MDILYIASWGGDGFADLVAFNLNMKMPTVFVETKCTDGKPTPEQREFMDLVNEYEGCLAIWAGSLDMFMNCMEHNYEIKKEEK